MSDEKLGKCGIMIRLIHQKFILNTSEQFSCKLFLFHDLMKIFQVFKTNHSDEGLYFNVYSNIQYCRG